MAAAKTPCDRRGPSARRVPAHISPYLPSPSARPPHPNLSQGFGQKSGTWHFRTTFLPPEEDMEGVIQRMADFHAGFIAKYS